VRLISPFEEQGSDGYSFHSSCTLVCRNENTQAKMLPPQVSEYIMVVFPSNNLRFNWTQTTLINEFRSPLVLSALNLKMPSKQAPWLKHFQRPVEAERG